MKKLNPYFGKYGGQFVPQEILELHVDATLGPRPDRANTAVLHVLCELVGRPGLALQQAQDGERGGGQFGHGCSIGVGKLNEP